MDTGRTIRPMVLVNTLTLMVLNTKGTGKMISKMEKEKSTGQMVPSTKDNTSSVKRTDMDSSSGLTDLVTTETLLTIIFMARVLIPGLMAEFTMETGNRIKCTEEVCSHGPMVVSTKENMLMIKNTAMAYIHIQMVDLIRGNGPQASNTERVSL